MIEGYRAGGFTGRGQENRAQGYAGNKEWYVTRGNRVQVIRAPSAQAAIKTALERDGLDWRKVEHYGACVVKRARG